MKDPKTPSELITMANEALAQYQFAKAYTLFEKLTDITGETEHFLLGKIISLMAAGKKAESQRLSDHLRRKYPTSKAALQILDNLGLERPNENQESPTKVIKASDFFSGANVRDSHYIGNEVPQPLRVYQSEQIAVVGPYALLMTEDGRVLRESTADTNVQDSFPQEQLLPSFSSLSKRKGDFAVLSGFWSEGFFHWMLEWLPKVLLLEEDGFKGKYLIPPHAHFIIESLLLLGIAEERMVPYSKESFIPDQLFLTDSMPAYLYRQTPGLLLEVRARLLNAAQKKYPLKSPHAIYVSRRNLERPRRVINEHELTGLFHNFNVTTIDTEALSLGEQISLMKDAHLFIGGSGAGMVHSLFMPPQSVVVELMSPLYINPVGLLPSDILGHRYYMLPSYFNDKYEYGHDIEAFEWPLSVILKQELGSSVLKDKK